jgi:predicted nucleic acid-binding protein
MRVVDASVVIKWHIDEDDSDAAQVVRHSAASFAVPDLLFLETASVVWKNVRRGFMSSERALEIVESIADGPFEVHSNQALARDAVRIGLARDITPYDASYIALAISIRADYVTADRKLFNKLQGSPFGRHVILLSDDTN